MGKGKGGGILWLCQCDCGEKTIVRSDHLSYGHTTSCGCAPKGRKQLHGDAGSRLYKIWEHAKSRCRNPNDRNYKNYGGRGIQFSEEWDHYEPFKEWALANGYQDDLTIDRIDNNKGYSPDNCRWATWKEQQNNKRTNRMVEYDGKTQTVSQWAEELGVPYGKLYKKINKELSAEEVAKKMKAKYNNLGDEKPSKNLDNGILPKKAKLTMTVEEMACELNISRATAYDLANNNNFYPALRIGHRIVVSTQALIRWLDEQTRGGLSDG